MLRHRSDLCTYAFDDDKSHCTARCDEKTAIIHDDEAFSFCENYGARAAMLILP
jgi:hypothetical protein